MGFWIGIICISLWGCESSSSPGRHHKRAVQTRKQNCFLQTPTPPLTLTLGDSLPFELGYRTYPPDSIRCFVNEEFVSAFPYTDSTLHTLPLTHGKIGDNLFRVRVHYPDSSPENVRFTVRLFAKAPPRPIAYQILRSFVHDESLYTQGLISIGDTLYEGTGMKGESLLRKYGWENGKTYQEVPLANQYFGEGITLFKNQIFQLTYQSNKIFIYNQSSLEKIEERYWAHEGWGMTTDGTDLIISDGTDKLYFVNPQTLQENRQIQVGDHEKTIDKLNELEYVNGIIYANVWQTDHILAIDPETGKVLGILDLTGILPGFEATKEQNHVLNGIAYVAERNTFIVTGKRWPRMFELQLMSDFAKHSF